MRRWKERPMKYVICVLVAAATISADAELRAGAARVSITPSEANLPIPLGGYGARDGKLAEGVHDTLYAKALVFDQDGKKSALVALDVCSLPHCVVEESLAKAKLEGLTADTVMMVASHSHTGLEGMALDRRNVADNPHIGIFSEPLLNFVTDRVAQVLGEANVALQPVTAAAGVVALPGMNRNRRKDTFIDEDLTLLRLDAAGGRPYAILVNFTAHGTIVSEREMLASAEWAGSMQRTVEALLGEGVTCFYTNGAEGDMSPAGARGASAWERFEDYGRRVGIAAARLAGALQTRPAQTFAFQCRWVDLPPKKGAPDFVKIAGDEYHVTQEQLDQLLPALFPDRAQVMALRVNDFQMVTFPGEPICQFGLTLKRQMREAGIKYPCVAALTNDSIGYILTKEEYAESGYEVTASFYGDGLGALMLENAGAVAQSAAGE
ncbi:MAG: neutral/alkaline non-lysosomal ceramidase N-terminal domain-containing protein [Candidatus Hydrogenedentes bacterium]|nr:neutral/alkaline non-lysosomal ceramidase N-terminal domain-containing protein [Candidatus Hydrogenedentota bacterium]